MLDAGTVKHDKITKLCGEHSEHAYEALRFTTHGSQPVACMFGPDGNTVICSTSTNSIAVYDTNAFHRTGSFQKGPRRCSNVFNSSLTHVAVYGDPVAPAIELQVCNTGKFIFLEGHTAEVKCCCMSADGGTILSGGREGQLFLWQLQQSAENLELAVARQQLLGHSTDSQVKCCCMSADGTMAVSGGTGSVLLLWDISLPEAVVMSELKLPHEVISCCCVSADGSMIAAGGKGAGVVICGADRVVHELPAKHADGCKIRSVALSPDMRKLVSAGDDGKAVLWETNTRQAMLVISEHTRPVRSSCFSPDGSRIATCGDDNLVVVLDVALLTSYGKLRSAMRMWQDGTQPAETGTCPKSPKTPRTPKLASATGGGTMKQGADIPVQPMLNRMLMSEGSRLMQLSLVPDALDGGASPSGDSLDEAVFCVEQSGEVLRMEASSREAHMTGVSCSFSIACCSFDADVMAAARRDGTVSVMGVTVSHHAGDIEAAAPSSQTAATTKLDMLVFGISLCASVGHVAVAGSDRKQTGNGVLWVWEYNPVEIASPDSPAAGTASLDRLGSTKSALSEVFDPAEHRPHIDAYAHMGTEGTVCSERFIHRENPLKALSTVDTPLLCCAWAARGERVRLVTGSAAGWLSVIDLEEEELDETPVCKQWGC